MNKGVVTAIISVLVILLLGAAWYFIHPAINLADPKFDIFILVIFTAISVACFMIDSDTVEIKPSLQMFFITLPVIFAIVGLTGLIIGSTVFHSDEYHNQVQVENKSFTQDITTVDFSTIPLMDKDTAKLIGDRAMGSMADLVSQYDISDNYSQINLNNMPVRVSPLVYDDFFKWLNSKDKGIPGYVRVNMSNENAEIVRTPSPIWYTDGEHFERNIKRHVQFSYPTEVFAGFYFEIDDNGTPYWICPIRSFNVFPWGAETVNDVVLCNALTGECEKMALSDVPEWCDKVIPVELLIDRYNWYGKLGGGWLNSVFGQTNVTKTTKGYNYLVIDNDIYAYTGVTSAAADNAIVGFCLINQRTGETSYYSIAGATEDSAMESAKGQVQQMEYEASFPLLVNIAEQPTYIMTLKDKAGLVKMYAMVDVQRYQNVATGNTLAQTLTNYTNMLKENGIKASTSGMNVDKTDDSRVQSENTQISGKIKKMTNVVRNGNTHFIVQLEDDNTKYDFDITTVVDIIDYAVGDKIDFVASNDNTDGVYVVSKIGMTDNNTSEKTNSANSEKISEETTIKEN